jgi:hypothetical protein
MAQEMLSSGRLSPPVLRVLRSTWGAFLLGITAPDVQTVSHQPRRTTHFYDIPPRGDRPAHATFLVDHPSLARAQQLEDAHASFVAGYLAHLVADEAWWREVFDPFFGLHAGWGEWEERIFLHNVLRTHLDRQDQARLNGDVAGSLASARPNHWLPFVEDEAIRSWRDDLVAQLQPGHHVRTAEVFAARMHLEAEVVEEALNTPQQMDRIFRHASRSALRAYRTGVLHRSIEVINTYLGG